MMRKQNTEIIDHETLVPPVVLDPETGEVETLSGGRVAVIGKGGLERVVTLPVSDDLNDVLVAARELTYSA